MEDYKKLLEKAELIATQAHEGQKRWGGEPYIIHPEAVARFVSSKECKIVAWLHDVIEDTTVSLDFLTKSGFPDEITKAIWVLTKAPDEDYLNYILRVCENRIAKIVKVADITHNLSTISDDCSCIIAKYNLARYIIIMKGCL